MYLAMAVFMCFLFNNHCLLITSSLYENIGIPYPGDEKMVDALRQSVTNSRKKRYHGDKGIEVLSPEGTQLCACMAVVVDT